MSSWCHIAASIAFLSLSGCEKPKSQPSSLIDNAVFRDRVIGIARVLFPDVEFRTVPDEPDVVLAGEMRLGLQNIRAKFQLEQHSDDELRDLVEDHFGPVIHKEAPSIGDFSLDELRDQIFPQVMPSEYLDAASLPLVSFPLASGIRIGFVANFPETYMYLREEDLTRWGISEEAIYEIALENLEEASREVDIHLNGNGAETFLAIESGDGYDAARILMPGMQKFFSSHLGENFRFGIPNRDFLICWRIDCPEGFHEKMQGEIIRDNSERPYPLSSSVFIRNSEGNVQEQKKR